MKSSVLIERIAIFLFFGISSCSNEVPSIKDGESLKVLSLDQSEFGIRSIVLEGDTLNLESFFAKVDTVLSDKDDFYVSDESLGLRVVDENIMPMTFTGSQTFTYTSDKSYIVSFTKEVANGIGLNPDYSYRCKLYLAQLRVGYPAAWTPLEMFSPQCGFRPGQSSNFATRGYELQLVAGVNSFVVSTYIFHVLSASDRPISYTDVYAPCRPENVVWDCGFRTK